MQTGIWILPDREEQLQFLNEDDLLKQKPRKPRSRFMDRGTTDSIFTTALGLFLAVSFIYLTTWFRSGDTVASQTSAFFAWLVGHVLLTFNLRSERQPLLRRGADSNRLMIVWGILVAVFLAAVSLIPAAQSVMKITTLSVGLWSQILLATFIGTFWLEIKKWLRIKSSRNM